MKSYHKAICGFVAYATDAENISSFIQKYLLSDNKK
jgi:hypothetical protein